MKLRQRHNRPVRLWLLSEAVQWRSIKAALTWVESCALSWILKGAPVWLKRAKTEAWISLWSQACTG